MMCCTTLLVQESEFGSSVWARIFSLRLPANLGPVCLAFASQKPEAETNNLSVELAFEKMNWKLKSLLRTVFLAFGVSTS